MRTGSVGNRDADSLFNTLPEPKKTILGNLRRELLSLGYDETPDYDAINVESYILYSLQGEARFILKHKWELTVLLIVTSLAEQNALTRKFEELSDIAFERNEDSFVARFDPKKDKELVVAIAKFFAKK